MRSERTEINYTMNSLLSTRTGCKTILNKSVELPLKMAEKILGKIILASSQMFFSNHLR